VIGGVIGRYYIQLGQQLYKQSDKIVLITDDFRPLLQEWGVGEEKLSVIPSWAPLEDLMPKSRENA